MIRLAFTAALLALAACDGSREDQGEAADNASGAVDGEDAIESGPAESAGERQDDAADAADDARDAQADALEEQADAARDAADQKAEAPDQQADNVRGH